MSASRNGVEPIEPSAAEGQGVPPNAAQRNAAFLSDIGLLIEEKPGRFKPTGVGMQFINTQLADDSRGRRLLRSLVEKTWFGSVARSFLADHGSATHQSSDLRRALSDAAASSGTADKRGVGVLVQYLEYTGIISAPTETESASVPAPVAEASDSVDSKPMVRSSRPPTSDGTPEPRNSAPSDEETRWEEIRTSEFFLKIQPKLAAVKRLRKQLDLLDEQLRENTSPKRKSNESDT